MALIEVKVPQLSESVAEATLLQWHKLPGDAIERDEIAALLGRRVEDLAEANAQLEQLVLASGPERDTEFLRYFLRRILREHELHRPALLQYGDKELQPFE